MGKVILSERQYKNLKKSLVSHSIEESIGKKPNLRLINENVEIENIGRNINKLLAECNGVSSESSGLNCLNKMNGYLKQLNTKDKLVTAAKFMSYWYVNNWAATLGWFLDGMMNTGTFGGSAITEAQALTAAQGFKGAFKIAGGTLNYSTISKEIDGEYKTALKPKSFTLTWSSSSTPTSNTPTTSNTNTTINWTALTPEQIAGFQHWYWKVVEKDLPLAGGDENDVCTALYKSALCGGRACTKRVAVDGTMGPSTTALMNNRANRPTFEAWWKTGTNSTDYNGPPKKNCGGVSYTNNTQKQPIQKQPIQKQQNNTYSGGGGSTSYLDWD